MSKNRYPKHQHSKYVDSSFSFDNRVHPSEHKNMQCDGGIMLEPRLQEYMRKKKYNKRNGIEPTITPEQEFRITREDRHLLRAFLKGNSDIYNSKKIEKRISRSHKSKNYFPSKGFRDDPRVPQLDNNKSDKPLNRGMFVPDNDEAYYEDPIRSTNLMLDSRDFATGGVDYMNSTGFSLNDTRNDPRTDIYMDQGEEKFDKYQSQYRVNKNDPRNGYIVSDLSDRNVGCNNNSGLNMVGMNKAYSSYDNYQKGSDYGLVSPEDKDRFYKNTGYGNFAKPMFSEKSHMDTNNKIVIPNVASSSKKNINTSNYRMMPFFGDPNAEVETNIDIETAMIRGMPSNTKKSYGYRNPAEHFYDYVREDFNSDNFVVEPWLRGGVPTRSDNKATAKRVYSRDIM